MILADTSVWVAHLKQRGGDAELIASLEAGVVASHPFVEGELSLSGAPVEVLLAGVEMLPASTHAEVRAFVHALPKPVRGLGWVDVHLVHCALVSGRRLITRDRRLAAFYAGLVGG